MTTSPAEDHQAMTNPAYHPNPAGRDAKAGRRATDPALARRARSRRAVLVAAGAVVGGGATYAVAT